MSQTVPARRERRQRQGDTNTSAGAPVWPDVPGGPFKPLAMTEVAAVEEAILHLLETLGLSQAIPSMVERVVARGGHCTEDKRLLFPHNLVLETIAKARRNIDLDLSGVHVHMSSGGGAPGVFDLDDGHDRVGSLKDLYDAARICDAMENIHHFNRSIVAQDIEDNTLMDLNTAYACLMGTSKHVSVSVTDRGTVQALAALCYQRRGARLRSARGPS